MGKIFVDIGTHSFGALLGIFSSNMLWLCQRKVTKKEEAKCFLFSVKEEVSNLWEIYYDISGFGKYVETVKEEEAIMMYLPINEDYFIFYRNNCSYKQGISHELWVLIVKTYASAAVLKDAVLQNNNFLQKSFDANHVGMMVNEGKDVVHSGSINKFFKHDELLDELLIRYAVEIKKAQNRFNALKNELISAIEKRLPKQH